MNDTLVLDDKKFRPEIGEILYQIIDANFTMN
jgi:hypothetical protein